MSLCGIRCFLPIPIYEMLHTVYNHYLCLHKVLQYSRSIIPELENVHHDLHTTLVTVDPRYT